MILTGSGVVLFGPVNSRMQQNHLENPLFHAGVSAAPPPFAAPPNDTATVLDGMRKIITPEERFSFSWRLFAPQLSTFVPGDFWISFDISCELPDKLENVIVELEDPDDPSDTGGIMFGDHFEWSILTQEGEFVQYTGFRNSTYFFMNDTYPS
ncbi:hypothetical protein EU520_01065, partial [Candidatus Thorarchaeota archaeon]